MQMNYCGHINVRLKIAQLESYLHFLFPFSMAFSSSLANFVHSGQYAVAVVWSYISSLLHMSLTT